MSFLLTVFELLILIVFVAAQNDCYHAWNERSSTGTCTSDADCRAGSSCIFSLNTNSRICCGPKAGAILPACPPGKNLPPLGSSSGIVCSGPDDVEQCPSPFKCTESATNFEKLSGQSNFICCS
ncbi:hypothetical protein M3Y98_01165800 [Aphelenchoides besseyi]|nr:hypothetical protein M3Y98_01165800 [Aphelenchoides besseyi]KAI6210915.1 hypothetical protein M3Y96_00378300 [Aphelenchoides besseyi]